MLSKSFVAPGSVYALHPTTEAVATAAAATFRPEPASRWELERGRYQGGHHEDSEDLGRG